MDWSKGKFTGKPHIYSNGKNHGFRLRISRENQSIDCVCLAKVNIVWFTVMKERVERLIVKARKIIIVYSYPVDYGTTLNYKI